MAFVLATSVLWFGAALAYPTWSALFTRHIDKGQEAMEWVTYHMLSDLGGAAAASAGGIIAGVYGFDAVFIFSSAMAFVGTISLLLIRHSTLLTRK